MQQKKQSKEIELTIISVQGENRVFKFKQTDPVEEVKKHVLDKFGIVPTVGERYYLVIKRDDRRVRLDENKTLLDEGIKDGDQLVLASEQVAGSTKYRNAVIITTAIWIKILFDKEVS